MFTKDWTEKWLPGPPHACSLYSEDSIFKRPWVCPVFSWAAVLALTLFGADKQQLWKSQGGGDRAGEMVRGGAYSGLTRPHFPQRPERDSATSLLFINIYECLSEACFSSSFWATGPARGCYLVLLTATALAPTEELSASALDTWS